LNILEMNRAKLMTLPIWKVREPFSADEIFHIVDVFGASWSYDYEAAKRGKVGLHAKLKSGRHANRAFNSRVLFQAPNIRRIMACQIAMRLYGVLPQTPDYVAGIPNGATDLGKDLAWILSAKEAEMKKCNGKIHLVTNIGLSSILFVDDFFSVGTGLREAVLQTHQSQPEANIVNCAPSILNLGEKNLIVVEDVGIFPIFSVADGKVQSWEKSKCVLCNEFGSKPIKFKETDENWTLLTTSQK